MDDHVEIVCRNSGILVFNWSCVLFVNLLNVIFVFDRYHKTSNYESLDIYW